MNPVIIGVVVAVVVLIVILVFVGFFFRKHLKSSVVEQALIATVASSAATSLSAAQETKPLLDEPASRSQPIQRENQSIQQKLSTNVPQSLNNRDRIFQKLPSAPPVKAILFLDFDQTLSTHHMWYATNGVNDPSILTPDIMRIIFGSDEYVDRLKRFWTKLNLVPGLEIQVLSKSWENMIRSVFEKLALSPMPAKITGTDTLQRLNLSKSGYVAQEIAKRGVEKVFFVDDTLQERQDMAQLLPNVIICCEDLKNGLSEKNMQTILQSIAKVLDTKQN